MLGAKRLRMDEHIADENDSEEWTSPKYFESMAASYQGLKASGTMSDCVIKVGKETLHVHRFVLSTCSKYFEAMFSHENKENLTGVVDLSSVDTAAVKLCVEFMYTGKATFSIKNPENLIYVAEMLQLNDLTDMYFTFLKKKLSSENCLKYALLADTYGRSFGPVFGNFTEKSMAQIIAQKDFSLINESFFSECLKSICSTELKWNAISKWINGDRANRKVCFDKLFSDLNLRRLSKDFLKDRVLTERFVNTSPKFQVKIANAILYPEWVENSRTFEPEATYLVACHTEGRMLYCMNMETQKWSRFIRIPSHISLDYLNMTSIGKDIYLSSGNLLHEIQDEKFVKVNLPHHGLLSRCETYHQCIVHGKMLIFIFSDRMSKYDTQTGSWSAIDAKVNLGSGFFVAASLNYIYAMGGDVQSKDAKEFDLKTEQWFPIGKMVVGRRYGAAICHKSKVFAFGGNSGADWEFYTPASNIWTIMQHSLGYSRHFLKAFLVGHKVYLVGGKHKAFQGTMQCKNCNQPINYGTAAPIIIFNLDGLLRNRHLESKQICSMDMESGLVATMIY